MLRAMANRKVKPARGLDGQVALVTGGGEGAGKAVALALAARGVRVVVMGRDERALGETVGEIANGGGKARHLAGDERDAAQVDAAVARARDVFGALDIAIASAGTTEDLALTFGAALREMSGPGRLLAIRCVGPDADARDATFAARETELRGLVRATARKVGARGITCNAVIASSSTADDDAAPQPEEIAELIVFLCSAAGDAITGQAIAMGEVLIEA